MSEEGKWVCHVCGLSNGFVRLTCKACGSLRPDHPGKNELKDLVARL